MKRIQFGAGFAIFIIFFGIAVLEAIKNKNVLLTLFWLMLGFAFLFIDNMKRHKQE